MIHWLGTTISGSGEHHLAAAVAWHGRLMVLAWSILIPVGVLAARFGKVLPGRGWPVRLDHRGWWHAHRGAQGGGVAIASVALALIYGRPMAGGALALAHRAGGFALLAIGLIQIAGGLLRGSKGGPTDVRLRGDHFDMTARRLWFERIHKGLGWLAMPVALAVTVAGLLLADAPRWMALVIGGWWAAMIAAFVLLQRRGQCIDTYQAIWGVDPTLPGLRRPPIGWGVRRIAPGDAQG